MFHHIVVAWFYQTNPPGPIFLLDSQRQHSSQTCRLLVQKQQLRSETPILQTVLWKVQLLHVVGHFHDKLDLRCEDTKGIIVCHFLGFSFAYVLFLRPLLIFCQSVPSGH